MLNTRLETTDIDFEKMHERDTGVTYVYAYFNVTLTVNISETYAMAHQCAGTFFVVSVL